MENDPIKVMYAEHDIIKKAEKVITNLNGVWKKNASAYTKTVDLLIIFFREYADGYHHRKEEEILFPVVNNHPDFVLQEIIEEFKQHHESFRDFIREIKEALDENNFLNSYNLLQEYCNDLFDHIAAEDDELFVLAKSLMNEEELETIFFKFKDIDLELGEEHKASLENSIEAMVI